MLGLEEAKKQEIDKMVSILKQIDLTDILLLSRDANTLLLRQKEEQKNREQRAQGEGESYI